MEAPKLADLIIERLNDIAKTDPVAIDALLRMRVTCNEQLANHPTVQVIGLEVGGLVGLLGILNGLVGVINLGRRKGWGYISAEFDDNDRLVRFVRTDDPSDAKIEDS